MSVSVIPEKGIMRPQGDDLVSRRVFPSVPLHVSMRHAGGFVCGIRWVPFYQ
jgi:hypothetical protein